MKKAIIVWSGWQDGTIMLNFLKEKKYAVLWIDRSQTIGIGKEFSKYNKEIIDILDSKKIDKLIQSTMPDEIYYLAAYHHSSQDIIEENDILLEKSYNIHVKGYANFLEAIRKFSPTTKIFYASSCLIFGWTETKIQDENTPPCPNSIYWITKLDWMFLWKLYRDSHNIFSTSGILYNHESKYRSPKFVSMKIIQWALDIKNWKSDKLVIGDLSAQVDRWYAYDYIEAMYWILQQKIPDDFIISSWEIHTVQELVEIVFDYLWLDWKKHVMTDKNIIQRKKWILFGNNNKILKNIWWKPSVWFKKMIIDMI